MSVPHDTTGPSGVVQQFPPDQWPTTLPCNANTPMKYFLPDDSPLNVVLVVEVVFSVWGLPATANWIFAEYFVAPVTEFHENTIDVDVADSHVNPVGAGSGSDAVVQAREA